MIKFLKAGGAVALSWGGMGDGVSDTGLWTSTTAPGGGQALPWFYSAKAFKDYFSPGTKIYHQSHPLFLKNQICSTVIRPMKASTIQKKYPLSCSTCGKCPKF